MRPNNWKDMSDAERRRQYRSADPEMYRDVSDVVTSIPATDPIDALESEHHAALQRIERVRALAGKWVTKEWIDGHLAKYNVVIPQNECARELLAALSEKK